MRTPRALFAVSAVPAVCASVLALAVGIFARPLVAEDVDPAGLFTSAKTAYDAKQYGRSLADLQILVGEVGRRRLDALRAHLPAAPQGWTAEPREDSDSVAGWAWLAAGSHVERTYRKEGGGSVKIDVYADAGMVVNGLVMVASNPAFLGPDAKAVTVQGRRGVLQYAAKSRDGKLILPLGVPGSVLQLEGNDVERQDLGDLFPAAIKLEALEKGIAE